MKVNKKFGDKDFSGACFSFQQPEFVESLKTWEKGGPLLKFDHKVVMAQEIPTATPPSPNNPPNFKADDVFPRPIRPI